MDAWAGTYGDRAAFVCVSCAGPQLAERFGKELELSRCTLTFTESNPSWGQLGCSGFIILDASLQVVCPKSLAYLEVRESAFRQVEAILDTLLEDDDSDDAAGPTHQQPGWAPLASSSGKMGGKEVFDRETGGCVAKNNKRPRGASSPAVAPLAPIDSVIVGSLDDQHSRCASALAELARSQSRGALEAVEAAYAEHFGFEEELLDRHLYQDVVAPEEDGKAAPSFNADRNARKSHFADHANQLNGVRDQLEALSAASSAVVPAAFVDHVLRAFESHADRYDSYGERLAAALQVPQPRCSTKE